MITIICIVSWCLGWRIVTDEGQLLYFIRKPFEDNLNRIERLESLNYSGSELFQRKALNYFGKPFVLCITCMASIWGIVIFTYINSLTFNSVPQLIFSCVTSSFIQTLIWKIYAKLD